MVIIRVGLANRANQRTSMLTSPMYVYQQQPETLTTDRRNGVQVHITTLVESTIENDQHLPMNQMALIGGESKRRSEIKFDGIEEVV